MRTMQHRGYPAHIEYSEDDGCFVGHIAGIRDIVGFHGDSVAELRTAFEEAVDDYLDACARLGKEPQKSYSGNLMLRLPPELHAAVATAAEIRKTSINQWVTDILNQQIQESAPRGKTCS